MTTQVPDTIKINGVVYGIYDTATLKWANGDCNLFDVHKFAAEHGIEPEAPHTGCWRGCQVIYKVTKGTLYVSTVIIHSPINGRRFDGLRRRVSFSGRMRLFADDGSAGDAQFENGRLIDFIDESTLRWRDIVIDEYQKDKSLDSVIMLTDTRRALLNKKTAGDLTAAQKADLEIAEALLRDAATNQNYSTPRNTWSQFWETFSDNTLIDVVMATNIPILTDEKDGIERRNSLGFKEAIKYGAGDLREEMRSLAETGLKVKDWMRRVVAVANGVRERATGIRRTQ